MLIGYIFGLNDIIHMSDADDIIRSIESIDLQRAMCSHSKCKLAKPTDHECLLLN